MLWGLETAERRKYYFKTCFSYQENESVITPWCNNASVSIQDLYGNCSVIFLTNLKINNATEASMKTLMKRIVTWAKSADYTKFYFSSNSDAYPWQRQQPFLELFPFKALHEPYKSRRTSNMITWYQADILEIDKLLKGVKK